MDIRNNAGLSIFAVEEEGHIGIQTNTPKTKLHVAGGNGDVLATHGDFILGNTNVGLRFGIYTSGANAGTASISSVGNGTDRIEIGGDGQQQLIVDTKNDRFGFGTEPNVFMDMKTAGSVEVLANYTSSMDANIYQRVTLNQTITIDNDNYTYFISVKPETDGGWDYENEGSLYLRSVQLSENPNF